MLTQSNKAESNPSPPPRRQQPSLRVRSVLAAHADLVRNREQFPVAETDLGDIATLLLVVVDLLHADLEQARAEGAERRKDLAAIREEVATLSSRAARTEVLLKELVKQAKAGNLTANDQADLLDELVEAVARGDRGPAPMAEARGEDPDLEEEDQELEEDDDLPEPEDDLPEEEPDAPDGGDPGDGGPDDANAEGGPAAEVVEPDAIIDAPVSGRAERPGFSHPRAA